MNETGGSIEDPDSNFNQHRLAVIRYSIEKNLSIAIANYNNYTGVETNFLMPQLKEDEWSKIINNISIISFLQGLNIGGKVYNGYSIINNTKNNEYVSEDSIYIADNDNKYYKITDKDLQDKDNSFQGVLNIDFERRTYVDENGNTRYYYPKEHLASYNSIVNESNVDMIEDGKIYKYLAKEELTKIAKAYYTALGRERYSMYRTNNNNDTLTEENKYKPNEYTVKFDSNGGDGIIEDLIIKEGNDYTITSTEPKRVGYTFKGWSTDPNATLPTYHPGDTYNEYEDITLYAVWWKNIEFNITGELTTEEDNLLTGVKFSNNEMYTMKNAVLTTSDIPKCKIENIRFSANPSGWISIKNNNIQKLGENKLEYVKIENIEEGNLTIELTSNKATTNINTFVYLEIGTIQDNEGKFYQPIIKK